MVVDMRLCGNCMQMCAHFKFRSTVKVQDTEVQVRSLQNTVAGMCKGNFRDLILQVCLWWNALNHELHPLPLFLHFLIYLLMTAF